MGTPPVASSAEGSGVPDAGNDGAMRYDKYDIYYKHKEDLDDRSGKEDPRSCLSIDSRRNLVEA